MRVASLDGDATKRQRHGMAAAICVAERINSFGIFHHCTRISWPASPRTYACATAQRWQQCKPGASTGKTGSIKTRGGRRRESRRNRRMVFWWANRWYRWHGGARGNSSVALIDACVAQNVIINKRHRVPHPYRASGMGRSVKTPSAASRYRSAVPSRVRDGWDRSARAKRSRKNERVAASPAALAARRYAGNGRNGLSRGGMALVSRLAYRNRWRSLAHLLLCSRSAIAHRAARRIAGHRVTDGNARVNRRANGAYPPRVAPPHGRDMDIKSMGR